MNPLFALTGAFFAKDVYSTFDNQVFIEHLMKHESFPAVVDAMLDTLRLSTTSDAVASKVDAFKPIAVAGLRSFSQSGSFDLVDIARMISGSTPVAPEPTGTSSAQVTETTSAPVNNVIQESASQAPVDYTLIGEV